VYDTNFWRSLVRARVEPAQARRRQLWTADFNLSHRHFGDGRDFDGFTEVEAMEVIREIATNADVGTAEGFGSHAH